MRHLAYEVFIINVQRDLIMIYIILQQNRSQDMFFRVRGILWQNTASSPLFAEMCSTEETIKQFNDIVEIFSNCVDGKILREIREHKKYCVQSIKNKAMASAQVSEIDSPMLKENAFICLPQSKSSLSLNNKIVTVNGSR